MILSSLIYSDSPPPFRTARICHYVPASWLKNCKIYQFLLNSAVKENFQFCHASENMPHHYNSLVAANTTGHSLFLGELTADWRKEGGSGLAVHAEKVNNGAKSWTLESLLTALSPLVCCVSGEILVTPVQRHWDIWPEQGISASKFFYHFTPRLTSSIRLWLFDIWSSLLLPFGIASVTIPCTLVQCWIYQAFKLCRETFPIDFLFFSYTLPHHFISLLPSKSAWKHFFLKGLCFVC